MAKRKQFNASVRFTEAYADLFFEMRAINGRELRVPVASLLEDIGGDISSGSDNAQQSVFMIDYTGDVALSAVWGIGNFVNKISTAANTVLHNGVAEWHFSRLDINNANLDLAHQTKSLWDAIIEFSEGAVLIFKIFNRLDKSQYVYLCCETGVSKANPSTDPFPTYDLKADCYVLKTSGIEGVTVSNASVAIIIARQHDVVRNNTDTYTSFPKIKNVITLTLAEYIALKNGTGTDPNTLYIPPPTYCSGMALPAKKHVFLTHSELSFLAPINTFIHGDTYEGGISIDIPDATDYEGLQIGIIMDAGENSVTLTTLVEGQKIGGVADIATLSTINAPFLLESDGVNWMLLIGTLE